MLRILLATAVLLGVVAAGLVATGTDPRDLLRGAPPKANYDTLRRGLAAASEVADRAAKQSGRGGTLAAARTLERAILYSRASARRTGTEPVPPHIRELFEDYFPEHILEDTRWALNNRNVDLGTVIQAWYGREGGAVTLKDTVVFSTRYAAAKPFLWAHELTHAVQYDELGVEGFARIYVTDPQFLEDQARENARRIVLDIYRQRASDAAGEAEAEAKTE